MKDISIIIVNYNTAEIVRNCINSILPQTGIDYEIIVADNASSDNSVELLQGFKDKIKLIINNDDLGFGKACNQAAEYATGKYFFFLNPDTLLHKPDDLKKIYEFAQANPQYGLITTQLVDPTGEVTDEPGYSYPNEKYLVDPLPPLPGKIAWVLGAVMIIPSDIFYKINRFDEDFFLYAEDLDVCLRIRKSGYEIGCFSDVSITHIGGASETKTDQYALTTRKYSAKHMFYKKHYSPASIKKLMKKTYNRARFRTFTHKILAFLCINKDYHLKKTRHYQAICDLKKAYAKYF